MNKANKDRCLCVSELGSSSCGHGIVDCASTLCEMCYARHRPSLSCTLSKTAGNGLQRESRQQAQTVKHKGEPGKTQSSRAKNDPSDAISVSSTESSPKKAMGKNYAAEQHVETKEGVDGYRVDDLSMVGNANQITYRSGKPIRQGLPPSCVVCGGSHAIGKKCGPKCGCSEVGLRSCAICTLCPNALCPRCKSYHAVDATVRCRFIQLGAMEARVARGSVTSIIQNKCGCIELGLPCCKDEYCNNHRCLDCGFRHSVLSRCGPLCGCFKVGRKKGCRLLSSCPNALCNSCLRRHLPGVCSGANDAVFPGEEKTELKRKRDAAPSDQRINQGNADEQDIPEEPLDPARSKRPKMARTRNYELQFGDIVLVEDEAEAGTGYLGKVYALSRGYVCVRWYGVEEKGSVNIEHGFEKTSWQPGYVAKNSNKIGFFRDGSCPNWYVGYTDIIEDVNVVLNFDHFEFGGRISKQGITRFKHLTKTHRAVKTIKNRSYERTLKTQLTAKQYCKDLFSSNVNTTVLQRRWEELNEA
mmetsp:Transcript_5450/g.9682  ORF Transcript_5450/g.9682 Transcript_5450/m.9682 type:complete len:528 (+) Transcript_5450:406-1989(+)